MKTVFSMRPMAHLSQSHRTGPRILHCDSQTRDNESAVHQGSAGGCPGWRGLHCPLQMPRERRAVPDLRSVAMSICMVVGYSSTFGWFGPNAFSSMARARLYSGSASLYFGWVPAT